MMRESLLFADMKVNIATITNVDYEPDLRIKDV